MSAGSLNQLFPSSGGGLGMALANPQNITAMQNWPQQPSPYTPQQQGQIDQLGNIFQQFVNPQTLGQVQPGQITNPLNQAIAAMGLSPYGVR
jgi:hypothetical protein